MYCKSCGKEILETSKFCPDCGAKIMENQENIKQKKFKMSRKVYIIIVLAALLTAGVVIFFNMRVADIHVESWEAGLDEQTVLIVEIDTKENTIKSTNYSPTFIEPKDNNIATPDIINVRYEKDGNEVKFYVNDEKTDDTILFAKANIDGNATKLYRYDDDERKFILSLELKIEENKVKVRYEDVGEWEVVIDEKNKIMHNYLNGELSQSSDKYEIEGKRVIFTNDTYSDLFFTIATDKVVGEDDIIKLYSEVVMLEEVLNFVF